MIAPALHELDVGDLAESDREGAGVGTGGDHGVGGGVEEPEAFAGKPFRVEGQWVGAVGDGAVPGVGDEVDTAQSGRDTGQRGYPDHRSDVPVGGFGHQPECCDRPIDSAAKTRYPVR